MAYRMALHGVGKCAVYVHSFNFISLPCRGLCHFRISLTSDSPSPDFHSHPYQLLILRGDEGLSRYHIFPAQILDEEGAYCSQTFYLKHSNEEVDLKDICVFRLDLPLNALRWEGKIVIRVRLMFLEIGPEDSSKLESFQNVAMSSFEEIAQGQLTLQRSDSGLHECFPVLFPGPNLCVCWLSIHTAIIDYRVHVSDESASPTTDQVFARFLFGKQAEARIIDIKDVDIAYLETVQCLRQTHNEIRSHLLSLNREMDLYNSQHLASTRGRRASQVFLPVSRVPLELHLPLLVKIGPTTVESSEVATGIFRFSDQINSSNPEKVAGAVLKEVHEISVILNEVFSTFVDWYRCYPNVCFRYFYALFCIKISDRYAEQFFKEVHLVDSVPLKSQGDAQKTHAQVASVRRKSRYIAELTPLPIQDTVLFDNPDCSPIIFEDVYTSVLSPDPIARASFSRSSNSLHVFVLVHGLGAHAYDMNRLANNLYFLYPEALILQSEVNEDLTDGDILGMGVRLAQEVQFYIKNVCSVDGIMEHLSFIGHSLGGLIIRAALPLLVEFKEKMHMFLSLSTPHLGCRYSASKLVSAGLWFYSKKWVSMQQMSMKDAPDLAQTALYRLSGYEGLSWFRHIVLCSSPQDLYTPYSSARMEVSTDALRDGTRGCQHVNMAHRLLEGIQVDRLKRLDVCFKFKKTDLSSAIGRSAHVDMLQNEMVMKMIMFRYPEFFA